MRTNRQMRRLADVLVESIRVPVPAEPEAVFDGLVAAVADWRGREIVVRREAFPPQLGSGLWLEAAEYDVIVVDGRAALWHQIVILCHEVWHMHRREGDGVREADGVPLAVAARTDFSVAEEQEAERFGMLMGRRLRGWLEEPGEPAAGGEDADGLAGRIGAALNYRGPRG
ncbi:toxin [Streptomyces sp. NPDC048182]|uniref:toxin n=1 Tax=Streptomyces sp. NPDC048182 TaxID=3365507 RepID=UPI00371352F1